MLKICDRTYFLSSIEKCSLPRFFQSQPELPDEQSQRQVPSSWSTFSNNLGHVQEITVARRMGSGGADSPDAILFTHWHSVWLTNVCFSIVPCFAPRVDTCNQSLHIYFQHFQKVLYTKVNSCLYIAFVWTNMR